MRLVRQELAWLRKAAQTSDELRSFIRRRLGNEPLQYILGSQPFGPLNIRVRPPILIPRPETEGWTIKFAEKLASTARDGHRRRKLLDLGTGSGCIPLLIAHLAPSGSLSAYGVDISEQAVSLANENAALCEIPSTGSGNTFHATVNDFLSPKFLQSLPIVPPFDILTANPPYISWQEYLQLPEDVAGYEDPRALFGGPSGLDYYDAIANIVGANGLLSAGAMIALEVGQDQGEAVRDRLLSIGKVKDAEIWRDCWGKQRTVVARK